MWTKEEGVKTKQSDWIGRIWEDMWDMTKGEESQSFGLNVWMNDGAI